MKRLNVALAAGLLLALAASGPLAAQDVTGTWILSVQLDAGSGDATFVLTQTDGRISGTYTGVLGDQQVSGSIEGSEFRWEFTSQAGQISFSGTVEGNAMEGTCQYGELGSGTFKGTKREST